MILPFFFFPLIAITVIAAPRPADDPSVPDVSILTSFKFAGCSDDQTNILSQNVKDAVTLAAAGLEIVHDELSTDHKTLLVQKIDFSKQAAIDFFGPEWQNLPYQEFITDALVKAANAYPGWGLSDWWSDRYVQLSCIDEGNSCGDKYAAYFAPKNHDYGYPLVVFCPAFFTQLPSHGDVVAKIDGNKDLQQNLANMRSRATTFLHELLHINWGTAQECSGEKACIDHSQIIGGVKVPTYKTGRAKLLAQRNAESASSNNDNIAYFAMAKFMENRWKQYPKYPAIWDPTKSRQENEDRDSKQPGAPLLLDTLDEEPVDQTASPNNDPVYSPDLYPEWYRPALVAKFEDPIPDLTQPSQSGISYNGPDINTEVTCETSDGSPDIQDCIHAFGMMRIAPTIVALQGKKDGTWWAGYDHSCALAIWYREDWINCNVPLSTIDDYASAIFEGCQNPANGKVGGKVQFGMSGCTAQIEIIKTSGLPPQGGLERAGS